MDRKLKQVIKEAKVKHDQFEPISIFILLKTIFYCFSFTFRFKKLSQ